MAARHVLDEVGQRLRDGRARVRAQQLEHLARGPAEVERPPDRGVGEAIDGGAAARLDVGEQRHALRELAGQRPRARRRSGRPAAARGRAARAATPRGCPRHRRRPRRRAAGRSCSARRRTARPKITASRIVQPSRSSRSRPNSRGVRQRSPAATESTVVGLTAGIAAIASEHLAAHTRRQRAGQVGTERREHLAAVVLAAGQSRRRAGSPARPPPACSSGRRCSRCATCRTSLSAARPRRCRHRWRATPPRGWSRAAG